MVDPGTLHGGEVGGKEGAPVFDVDGAGKDGHGKLTTTVGGDERGEFGPADREGDSVAAKTVGGGGDKAGGVGGAEESVVLGDFGGPAFHHLFSREVDGVMSLDGLRGVL